MPKYNKVVEIPIKGGAYRFCLDRVDRASEGERTQWAFVWRGNARGPKGFNPMPAFFDWGLLGKAIHQALACGHVPPEDFAEFFKSLCGVEDQKQRT